MIRLFSQFVPKRKILLVISEAVLLFLLLHLTSWVLFKLAWESGEGPAKDLLYGPAHFPPPWSFWFWRLGLSAFAVTMLCQLSISYNDLYDWSMSANRRELPQRLVNAAGATLIGLAILVFIMPTIFHFPGLIYTIQSETGSTTKGTWKLVFLVLIGFSLILCWRVCFHWFYYRWELGERLVILGTGPQAEELFKEIGSRGDTGYQVIGAIGPSPDEKKNPGSVKPSHYLGPAENLPSLTREHRVSRVVVALDDRRGNLPVEELLDCRMAGVMVEEKDAIFERITGKIGVQRLRPSYLIFGEGFQKTRMILTLKRILDILCSLVGLMVSSPVLVASTLAIKLDSPGGIFFKQPRVGQDGKTFMIYKLRSMRVDAEKYSGPVWAKKADDRITRVGRFLRATRIDEIPQMWNVLRGDMSFVGPRPERPFFVQELTKEVPYFTQRQTVKPGITGWAQINYPYGSSVEDAQEKLQYDLYYIKNISFLFDILIVLRTIRVVIDRRGT